MNIAILESELLTDPLGVGYAGLDDAAAAAALNALTRQRDVTSLAHTIVYNAIDQSDWSGLTNAGRQEVWDILHLGGDGLNPWGREADRFIALFGGGSATITTLAALRVESISRGDELGIGRVKPGHVAEARA